MKAKFHTLIFLAIIASLLIACAGGNGETTAQDSNILFQDDFSNQDGEWDTVRIEGEGIADYENDAYRIRVDTANTDVWANPDGLNFTDVKIEVEATKQKGSTDNNDFGVICRYANEENYYFFIISSDGYYGIGKVKDGSQELLGMDNMLSSDAIHVFETVNHIRAECKGSTLTLYVNDQKLDSQSDLDFTEGNVGLIAGTFDEAYTDILFDNFTVTKPK